MRISLRLSRSRIGERGRPVTPDELAKAREDFDKMYAALPPLKKGQKIRCPTHNADGTPIAESDIPGCGSENVVWAGDVYDCNDCGIFFGDYAADKPHRHPEADARRKRLRPPKSKPKRK